MYSTSAVVVLALATLGSAFNDTDQNYPYTIPAGSVSASTTTQWCQAQQNSCLQICGNQANPNSCDGVSLLSKCSRRARLTNLHRALSPTTAFAPLSPHPTSPSTSRHYLSSNANNTETTVSPPTPKTSPLSKLASRFHVVPSTPSRLLPTTRALLPLALSPQPAP